MKYHGSRGSQVVAAWNHICKFLIFATYYLHGSLSYEPPTWSVLFAFVRRAFIFVTNEWIVIIHLLTHGITYIFKLLANERLPQVWLLQRSFMKRKNENSNFGVLENSVEYWKDLLWNKQLPVPGFSYMNVQSFQKYATVYLMFRKIVKKNVNLMKCI